MTLVRHFSLNFFTLIFKILEKIKIRKKEECQGMFIIYSSLGIEEDKEYIKEAVTVKEMLKKIKLLHVKQEDEYQINSEIEKLKWTTESAEIYINKLKINKKVGVTNE